MGKMERWEWRSIARYHHHMWLSGAGAKGYDTEEFMKTLTIYTTPRLGSRSRLPTAITVLSLQEERIKSVKQPVQRLRNRHLDAQRQHRVHVPLKFPSPAYRRAGSCTHVRATTHTHASRVRGSSGSSPTRTSTTACFYDAALSHTHSVTTQGWDPHGGWGCPDTARASGRVRARRRHAPLTTAARRPWRARLPPAPRSHRCAAGGTGVRTRAAAGWRAASPFGMLRSVSRRYPGRLRAWAAVATQAPVE